MSNYTVIDNKKIAFHPGYAVEEQIEYDNLTQEEFARRIGTTPKNISKLINGEQSLSRDMALKLSRYTGVSVQYWLNMQTSYDAMMSELDDRKELIEEKNVVSKIANSFFDNFDFKKINAKMNEQLKEIRKLLTISSLSVLRNKDLSINFYHETDDMDLKTIINSNILILLATNISLKTESPKYNKKILLKQIDKILALSDEKDNLVNDVTKLLLKAGVVLVVLPDIKEAKVRGAVKKTSDHIMILITDKYIYSNNFWGVLFHELGLLIHGDFGIISVDDDLIEEDMANDYASEKLLPAKDLYEFIIKKDYSKKAILEFSKEVKRNPSIILNRLEDEKIVSPKNKSLDFLRFKYKVNIQKHCSLNNQ